MKVIKILCIKFLQFLTAWSIIFSLGYYSNWLKLEILITCTIVTMFVPIILVAIFNPDGLEFDDPPGDHSFTIEEENATRACTITPFFWLFLILIDKLLNIIDDLPLTTTNYTGLLVATLAIVCLQVVLYRDIFLCCSKKKDSGACLFDKGIFGIIRHPIYSCFLFYLLGTSLWFGSLSSFIGLATVTWSYCWRIRVEEETCKEGLDGYKEYKDRVRYRLIPLVY
eukprot:GHVP01023698.1.p1 GENE.GHVP01023698.1~~GHVP01023698.1.p1  ORF type:complete len:233 (+),score=26.34 GHVP01023698.1:25-699(+)